MLLTLETINVELRKVDRMQKREANIKVFRAQANRDATTQKKNQKKSNKAKKNATTIVATQTKNNKSKKHYFTCKKAKKNDNYHLNKC